MNIDDQTAVGSELEQLKSRFEEWRQHRKKGSRVPKELWDSAIRLSKDHSVSELARTLRLDYPKLKKRAAALRHDSEKRETVPPTFVEVGTTKPAVDADCILEFENSKGVKVKMHFRRGSDLDFAALGKAFWRNGG